MNDIIILIFHNPNFVATIFVLRRYNPHLETEGFDCLQHICERRYSKTVIPFLNIRALFWSANIRKSFSNSARHICVWRQSRPVLIDERNIDNAYIQKRFSNCAFNSITFRIIRFYRYSRYCNSS